MSPPIAAELTARNGNADNTASAEKANELFMKSADERVAPVPAGALLSNRSIRSSTARSLAHFDPRRF
jgi:hypothetical protein